jgi:hypothetical protein
MLYSVYAIYDVGTEQPSVRGGWRDSRGAIGLVILGLRGGRGSWDGGRGAVSREAAVKESRRARSRARRRAWLRAHRVSDAPALYVLRLRRCLFAQEAERFCRRVLTNIRQTRPGIRLGLSPPNDATIRLPRCRRQAGRVRDSRCVTGRRCDPRAKLRRTRSRESTGWGLAAGTVRRPSNKGRIDLLCGADAVTMQRAGRTSGFSEPIFPGGIGALLRADAPVRPLPGRAERQGRAVPGADLARGAQPGAAGGAPSPSSAGTTAGAMGLPGASTTCKSVTTVLAVKNDAARHRRGGRGARLMPCSGERGGPARSPGRRRGSGLLIVPIGLHLRATGAAAAGRRRARCDNLVDPQR